MKRLIFSFLLFGCTLGFSQTNWKDSTIAGKFKPLDAYELDGLVYFKTKKGWGVYWPVQSYLVIPPMYQFVLCLKPDMMDVFYVVKKNKIQLLSSDGKPLNNKTYDRLGDGYQLNERFLLENNKMDFYDGDKIIRTEEYSQLSRNNETSLTVKNNLVYINAFQNGFEPSPYRIVKDGFEEDSLDVKGNAVMQYYVPKMSSGVYDTKTGVWIVPLGAAKVGSCGTNILAKEITMKGSSLEEKLALYYKAGQKTGTFSFNDATSKPEIIKMIISDHKPVLVEACFKNIDRREQLFKFDNGLKQGIYDPHAFTVTMNADKYDFVFVPRSFEQTVFTIENAKVGVLNSVEKNKDYSNLYNKLSKTNFFVNATETMHDIVECNEHCGEPVSQIDTGQIDKNFLSQMVGFKQNASLEVNGNFIIQHDFTPKTNYYNEPIVVYDALGNAHDSIRYEESGETYTVYRLPEPSQSYGGVYNTVSKTWIVPRKFSKIRQTENGFACVLQRNDTVSFSFFSLEGKMIFNGLSHDSLIHNKELFNKFCGFKFSQALQIQKHEGIEDYYDALPLVLNDPKKSGVFDLYNIKWIIKPENDLVDKGKLLFNYLIVQNNRMGLVDGFGNEIAPPIFKKTNYLYHSGGYILDDSVFCMASYPYTIALTDTAKFLSKRALGRDYDPLTIYQKAEMINKKLYIEENTRIIRYGFDEVEYTGYPIEKAISFTRMIDPQNFKQTDFKNATKLISWKNGHLILDTLNAWIYLSNSGEKTEFKGATSISVNKDYVFTLFTNPNFAFNSSGKVEYVENYANNFYDYDTYRTVGYNSIYFDGTSKIELPSEFYLIALNKAKLGLGYTLVKNKNTYDRKYTYYDFNTKQYILCELSFAAWGNVDIVDINGYFVCMETDLKKNISNVWLLEQDLKTVKSSFLDLKSFSYEHVSNPLDQIILFKVSAKTKKEMYFDKDFEFILEADEDQFETNYPLWDRLQLKSAKKTVQMNLKGQILNK